MVQEHAASAAIHIHSETAAKLNFACHQSAFAFLRDLRIENPSAEASLDDVLVTLSANPAFLQPTSWRLDRIAPGEILPIKNRDIALDRDFLLNLADAVRGAGASRASTLSRP